MTCIGRLVAAFLNFLDRDRPANCLYERAYRLSTPNRNLTPEAKYEKIKRSLPLYDEALNKCRSKNPRKHDIHVDYAVAWYYCFQQDRTQDIIDNAVAQVKEADTCWPHSEKNGVHYANFQTNLGNICLARYLMLRDEDDLEHALRAVETALSSCPPGAHRERLLALLLRGRIGCTQISSMETPSPAQLNQPVNDLNQAIQLRVKDKDLTGSCHYNLAVAHSLRYEHTKTPEDLSQAITHDTQADVLLEGHPDRGPCLFNLAEAYARKYKLGMQTRSYKDRDVTQYLGRTWEMLDRAQEIGDDAVKANCARLRLDIQSFARSNTTNVLSASYLRTSSTSSSRSYPLPMRNEAHIMDSVLENDPPALPHMRLDQTV